VNSVERIRGVTTNRTHFEGEVGGQKREKKKQRRRMPIEEFSSPQEKKRRKRNRGFPGHLHARPLLSKATPSVIKGKGGGEKKIRSFGNLGPSLPPLTHKELEERREQRGEKKRKGEGKKKVAQIAVEKTVFQVCSISATNAAP